MKKRGGGIGKGMGEERSKGREKQVVRCKDTCKRFEVKEEESCEEIGKEAMS